MQRWVFLSPCLSVPDWAPALAVTRQPPTGAGKSKRVPETTPQFGERRLRKHSTRGQEGASQGGLFFFKAKYKQDKNQIISSLQLPQIQ